MVQVGAQPGAPSSRLVWYNDWRQVDVPALGEFVPELPVSVIVPYCAQAEELARTLAALEVQTYPRELFEVVVDDGSPAPLQQPRNAPLDVKVERQEDLGFGAARARQQPAAHGIGRRARPGRGCGPGCRGSGNAKDFTLVTVKDAS